MSKKAYSMTLLGCGKMGGAMLRSWIDQGLLTKVIIIDPSEIPKEFTNDPRIKHIRTADNHSIDTDVFTIAVKPQTLEKSVKNINEIQKATALLSILAGKSIKSLECIFSSDASIIRAMPNTPASIGKGANVVIANSNVSEHQKDCVSELLNCLGMTEWIEDESLMNAVTALSGSGPAYIFYIIEMLAHSGEKLGLKPKLAMSLARQTVIGSASLAESDKDTPACKLRENVTSPKGTTEAALRILMDGRAQGIFNEALLAARKRGEELNS